MTTTIAVRGSRATAIRSSPTSIRARTSSASAALSSRIGRPPSPEGRYAGRGPKGYQRSDERLKEEACEQLTADPDVDASEVEVSVQNGEVTLEGTVHTRNMKRAAEDCVEAISGVQQVHNRLRVESNEFGRDEGQFSFEE